MVPNAYAVLIDGNPLLIRVAFFITASNSAAAAEAEATAWRDANAGGAGVYAVRVDPYGLVVDMP